VTIYLVIPLLIVVALVQATIMPHLAIWGIFPDLPLLVVVSWSLLRGTNEGAAWGFIVGLAVDLLSGAPFGAATLSLVVVGYLSGFGKETVFGTHIALPMLAVFLATVGYDLLFLTVVQLGGSSVPWLNSLLRIILPAAVLNALLMPIVLGVMRRLHIWFGHKEMEW
jgi:rod shape-determining protein MreD